MSKQLTTINISQADFEKAIAEYADAERREAEINRKITLDVAVLHQLYESELQRLVAAKQRAYNLARTYCLQHKTELFAQRRSIGTIHGIAGFRLGTPKLLHDNWDKALEMLKAKLPDYVRTTEEPARNRILTDRHKENVAPRLVEMGMQVVQEEIFYIEPRPASQSKIAA